MTQHDSEPTVSVQATQESVTYFVDSYGPALYFRATELVQNRGVEADESMLVLAISETDLAPCPDFNEYTCGILHVDRSEEMILIKLILGNTDTKQRKIKLDSSGISIDSVYPSEKAPGYAPVSQETFGQIQTLLDTILEG